ncbi:hypothetical protein [Alloactinosynnema sp. L-07]|nr:hypothetical protein [Alloactinosynnema sp. L-07]
MVVLHRDTTTAASTVTGPRRDVIIAPDKAIEVAVDVHV